MLRLKNNFKYYAHRKGNMTNLRGRHQSETFKKSFFFSFFSNPLIAYSI